MKMQPRQNWMRRHPILFIFLMTIVLIFCLRICSSIATQTTYQRDQATPASTGPWVVTHTFHGNGNDLTENVDVGDTWKLQWDCGVGTTSENVIIDVYNADGTLLDPVAINAICDTNNNRGETLEHQGGTIYLRVVSEGGWTVKISEQV